MATTTIKARYPDLTVSEVKVHDQDKLFISEDQYNTVMARYPDVPVNKIKIHDQDKLFISEDQYSAVNSIMNNKDEQNSDALLRAMLWKLYGGRD